MRSFVTGFVVLCLVAPAFATGFYKPLPELEECCGYHVDFTIKLGKEEVRDDISRFSELCVDNLLKCLPDIKGELCYDGIEGSGQECVTPETGLSQFVIWLGPFTQTAEDVDGYPSKPKVDLYDGQVVGLGGAFTFEFYFFSDVTVVIELVGDDVLASVKTKWFEIEQYDIGDIYFDEPTYTECEVIPTPAAVSGGLALFAAMGFRRRHRRAA